MHIWGASTPDLPPRQSPQHMGYATGASQRDQHGQAFSRNGYQDLLDRRGSPAVRQQQSAWQQHSYSEKEGRYAASSTGTLSAASSSSQPGAKQVGIAVGRSSLREWDTSSAADSSSQHHREQAHAMQGHDVQNAGSVEYARRQHVNGLMHQQDASLQHYQHSGAALSGRAEPFSRVDLSHAAAIIRSSLPAAGRAPAEESPEAPQPDSPVSKRQKKSQGFVPVHGNYHRYYGYRIGQAFEEDPRMKVRHHLWHHCCLP